MLQAAVDYVIAFFLFFGNIIAEYFWPAVAITAIGALIIYTNL